MLRALYAGGGRLAQCGICPDITKHRQRGQGGPLQGLTVCEGRVLVGEWICLLFPFLKFITQKHLLTRNLASLCGHWPVCPKVT